MNPDPAAEARAELRRQTWQGGVVRLGAEADQADASFCRAATPEQRFEAVVRMALEAWHMEGNDGPVPRLRGSVGGVRKI